MASDAAVVAGTSAMTVQWFCTGTPSTNDHRNAAGSSSSSQARALPTAAPTLARLRTMPGSARQAATSSSPKAATSTGSNPAKHRA